MNRGESENCQKLAIRNAIGVETMRLKGDSNIGICD
jgi:hypothetical protein